MGGVSRTDGDVGGSGSGSVGGGSVGGVNLGALRSHNAALVLDLLRTAGPDGISRLELAERTGLTPQAVSKITARLREAGLAAEAGRRASTGGKPRTVLRLVPEAGHAVGVHLDRDELTAVLCDLTGAVVARRSAALDLGAGAETVVERAVRVVGELVGEGGRSGAGGGGLVAQFPAPPGGSSDRRPQVLGVGVALPGPLDHRRGVLHRVTGFPEWNGFPLRDVLARRLSLPVVVDKDTNAAALGLAVGGEAGALASFAYLHFGAGLGGGLVIGGAVHRGARTGAGEFGHQVVQLDGPPCGCGNRGCVEALCLAAVARGDAAEAARVLGTAAGNLVALLDVDLVLLGGRTVAAAPETFVRGVAAVLDERAGRAGEDPVPVRVAPGEGGGVAEGAAQLLLAPLFGRAEG
ncbi:ROK family transcriptional regulator [Streptomyces sp. HUAS 31]|uniref:ROK family transcriptional regulator n=1 Tax=Streptomyces sp. HUAS 31 TaxID=3020055 RepID=UPI0023058C10|nr:ROK family transcriptional regulator [Streptomyces sp. HUAS 31]WCD97147.1 ROK family transcriptional regulator [Streptomyces sp. HUAS 31]